MRSASGFRAGFAPACRAGFWGSLFWLACRFDGFGPVVSCISVRALCHVGFIAIYVCSGAQQHVFRSPVSPLGSLGFGPAFGPSVFRYDFGLGGRPVVD